MYSLRYCMRANNVIHLTQNNTQPHAPRPTTTSAKGKAKAKGTFIQVVPALEIEKHGAKKASKSRAEETASYSLRHRVCANNPIDSE
jgi:hypothetical protein